MLADGRRSAVDVKRVRKNCLLVGESLHICVEASTPRTVCFLHRLPTDGTVPAASLLYGQTDLLGSLTSKTVSWSEYWLLNFFGDSLHHGCRGDHTANRLPSAPRRTTQLSCCVTPWRKEGFRQTARQFQHQNRLLVGDSMELGNMELPPW